MTRLRAPVERRDENICQYTGFDPLLSGDSRTNNVKPKNPLNLAEMAVGIYTRAMISSNPKVAIRSSKKPFQASAMDLEIYTNQQIEKMRFADTLQLAVKEAMLMMGVVKLCLYPDDDGNMYPSIDVVPLPDWVHDATATRWEDCQFMGHRFRRPLSEAQDDDNYDKEARAKLSSKTFFNDENGGDVRSRMNQEKSFEEMVELWEVYLPTRNMVTTFHTSPEEPLWEREWTGPEHGPYHLLAFDLVPDSVIPLAPMSLWSDLAMLASNIMRKIDDQARRSKTNFGYRGGAEEDANRVTSAVDGEVIRMDNPDAVKPFVVPGVDQVLLATLLQVRNLFTYQAGNLDVLGGLSPQSDTLGQDRMIDSNASKRVQSMQEAVIKFIKQILTDLAWYYWSDPTLDEWIIHPDRTAVGIAEIPIHVMHENFKGDFFDYNFDVTPYSLQQRTPSQNFQMLIQLVQGVIVPLYPMLAQQGNILNAEALLRNAARDLNLPDVADIMVFQGGAPGQEVGMTPPNGGTQHTTRRYERVNRPGAIRQQQDEMMSQMLMSGQQRQPAEMATMNRTPG